MATITNAGTQITSASSSFTGAAATNLDKNKYRESITIQNQSTSTLHILLADSGTPSASSAHITLAPCAVAKDGTGGAWNNLSYKGAVRTSAVDKTVLEFTI